jgi:ADP-heptose:LPS heptosyltransferase
MLRSVPNLANKPGLDSMVAMIPPVRKTASASQILVGLIEHIGDIVACEPVARYLKLNDPEARLIWVVRPEYREIIDTNPYIDETVTVECLTDWIKLSAHGKYDRVVDLHTNYRACSHCQIPLVKRIGNPFVTSYEWFDYGALLEAFSVGAGLPRLSAQPRLYLTPDHACAVDALRLPANFCVIHRVSNDTRKDWTEESWKALSSFVQNRLGIPIVEVGAGKNHELPRPIDGVISLVNQLSILLTAEVIRRARFFIGIDSAPGHLANALKVPGVILLGQFHYFRKYCPYTGFYAGSSPLVKLIKNPVGSVAEISVDEVTDAVRYIAAAAEHLSHEPRGLATYTRRAEPWAVPRAPRSEAVIASGLFDLGWYVLHHPEVEDSSVHPVDHYLLEGAPKGFSPGSTFDFKAYQDSDGEIVGVERNAVLHYIDHGCNEGRRIPIQDISCDTPPSNRSQDHIDSKVYTISALLGEAGISQYSNSSLQTDQMPKAFAFYLPQFHPIPENNWAHGIGFSEWHNVIKAKPLFHGHYQPRIPGELGFYDLRSEEVLYQQIRLAQEHGISGFCFYYYSFNGRKLLYKPIENFLHSHIDAPFMCVWANENWTKSWDGGDREIIIQQNHSELDDLLVLRELVPLFNDGRYVKIHAKPVFMVYKPHLFPNIRRTVDVWRKEITAHGFPDIYLVMVDDWTLDPHHPRDIGFDASYEIPSNIVPSEVLCTDLSGLGLCDEFTGRIVDYAKFARYHMSRPFPVYRRFRTVMLPWDNTARYGPQAIVHVNGGGEAYKLWVLQAMLRTYQYFEPEERLVFLHSWNEWCEGTYLEPDVKHGRFFLEQTREAINTAKQAISAAGCLPPVALAAELLKLQKVTDSGAFQVMQSARTQLNNTWRELVAEHEAKTQSEAELKVLRYRLNQLDRENEKTQRRLESMRSSFSWKLTSPLREARRALARFTGFLNRR